MAPQNSQTPFRSQHTSYPSTPQLPQSASVLVLDDQRFDRHRLARLCSGLEMHCDITNAKTIAQFAQIIETAQFDLVMVDYGLPDGTGFDALSIVRLSPQNCNAATIMVSGQGQEHLAQQALEAGCSDYITKDELSLASINRAVTNALQKSVLITEVETQTSRSSETQAVLERFASKCARDIKPMVSRMMRQLRDMRGTGTEQSTTQAEQVDRVEESCMLLWDFLVDLESFQACLDDPEQEATPSSSNGTSNRKPPSPFARVSG